MDAAKGYHGRDRDPRLFGLGFWHVGMLIPVWASTRTPCPDRLNRGEPLRVASPAGSRRFEPCGESCSCSCSRRRSDSRWRRFVRSKAASTLRSRRPKPPRDARGSIPTHSPWKTPRLASPCPLHRFNL